MARTLKARLGSTWVTIASVALDTGMSFPDDQDDVLAAGWLTYVDGRGESWRTQRDAYGRIRAEYSPEFGNPSMHFVRTYAYGDSGNTANRLTQIVDELEVKREFTYDSSGNLTRRLTKKADDTVLLDENFEHGGPYPSNLTRRYLVVNQEERDEYVYEYYDASANGHVFGDLQSITDPLEEQPTDAVTTYSYLTQSGGLPGRVSRIEVTDRNGHVTRYDFNGDGNVSAVVRDPNGLALTTSYTYDACGRVTSKSIEREPNVTTETRWDWDDAGRLLTVTQEMGANDLVTTYTYDDRGDLTDVVDPRGVQTHYVYDYRNRLDTVTEDYGTGRLNLVTDYTPDGNGNVTAVAEPGDRTTSYEYNEQNHLVKVTDALGHVTRYERDGAGRVTWLRRWAGTGETGTVYEERYVYDELGRLLTKRVDPGDTPHLNLETTFEYTPATGCSCSGAVPGASLPNHVVDPKGKHTYIQYDALNRPFRLIRKIGDTSATPDANDAVEQFDLDPEGNLLAWHGPEGELVEFEYDAADRRELARAYSVTTTPEEFVEFSYTYDGSGNLRTLTQPDGTVRTMTYDLAGRLTGVVDDLGTIGTFTYDANGNVLTRATGLTGQTWTYEYDRLDRVTVLKDPIVESPQDAYATIGYDDANRAIVHTDAKGIQTKRQFDKLSRLVTLIENYQGTDATAGTTTTYGYDGLAQTSLADHDGNTTMYGYDAALRPNLITFADHSQSYPGQVQYTYDAAGNVATRVDQRDMTTTYTYDDLHQLATRVYSSRAESFAIDRSGRLTQASNGFVANALTYDKLGRVLTATQTFDPGTGNEVSYPLAYDYTVAEGILQATVTYPSDRQVTASWDGRARLTETASGPDIGVSWTFDAGGRRATAQFSNHVLATFGYDLANRLTSVQHAAQVDEQLLDPFHHVEYGYDAVGNRIWKWDRVTADRSETYTYDQRHRLIGFARGVAEPDPQDALKKVIVTPTSDPDLPNQQTWPTLDRRGNWRAMQTQIDTSVAQQTRTLNESTGDLGGKMNEYERISVTIGEQTTTQRRATMRPGTWCGPTCTATWIATATSILTTSTRSSSPSPTRPATRTHIRTATASWAT